MSASQQAATDTVHAALQALHDLGVSMQVSREALARLAGTSGMVPVTAPATAAPASTQRATTAFTPVTPATAETKTKAGLDLTGAFAAHLTHSDRPHSAARTEEKAPSTSQSRPPATARTAPTALAGASSLAPATGTKAERLAAMRGPVLACTKCPNLVRSRKQVVFGVGNPDAELMFIGEAPGADEDLVGEPFVGRAGQLLTKIIETMGLRRSDVYIANILKCRPDMPPGSTGNRKPEPDEMRTCKPYVLEQIQIIQPKVIVALGATAVEGLFEIEKAGITRIRGQWREFEGIPLMPTFHPSFLLRPSEEQQANKRLVWEDMLTVLEKLGKPVTEKQRAYFLPRS